MSTKYPEIKDFILKNINDEIYKEGDMLPPEREFTTMFEVSRMTIRRAFDELINDGILIRKKGSGVIVAPKKDQRSHVILSYQNDPNLIEKYGKLEAKVISLEVIKTHPVAYKIFEDYKGDLFQLKRVQYGSNKPIVYENIFIRTDCIKDLRNIDCSKSFQTILQENALTSLDSEDIVVEAKMISNKVSKILKLSMDTPILQITSIYKKENKVVLFSINMMNGDDFNYSVHNKYDRL